MMFVAWSRGKVFDFVGPGLPQNDSNFTLFQCLPSNDLEATSTGLLADGVRTSGVTFIVLQSVDKRDSLKLCNNIFRGVM